MGMGAASGGSWDSTDDTGGFRPVAEINVTPMVDVMLVLLIIFMVAAPLMTVGVPIQLPKTVAAQTAQPKQPTVLSIDKDGRVFLAKEELAPEVLLPRLQALATENPDQPVLMRGDKTVPYGRIMEVMGQVSQAGFAKVSLITEAKSGAAPAPASATTSPAALPATEP
jgi:biopolymer transport protein TolR